MTPSPNKMRSIHKSSGKPSRTKDKPTTSKAAEVAEPSSSSNGNNTNYTIIGTMRRDDTIDLKDSPLTLPEAIPLDVTKSLPRFASAASDTIVLSLDELDVLQLELELLLSSVLVREISFSHQYDCIDMMDKGKIIARTPSSPGKRNRQGEPDRALKKLKDNSGKGREMVAASVSTPMSKPQKVKCSVVKNEPKFDVPDATPQESPKFPPHKSDMINRFWNMVDVHCQEITADDIKLLEEFIDNQNDENDHFKIPPLGRHYSIKWAQEDLMDEQKEGSKGEKRKLKNENGEPADNTLREVNINGCDDVAPIGPLAQRIIAGLVEENSSSENVENKSQGMAISRPGFIKNLGLANPAMLEKRLKKELHEQGIIDDNCNDEDEDEVLMELKMCQNELKTLTAHNHGQLSKLLKQSREALVRHDLKKKLRDVDAKVIETYKMLSAGKQKKKLVTKKDKEQSWKCLKEREAILRQLDMCS